jgi:hypothetical protein
MSIAVGALVLAGVGVQWDHLPGRTHSSIFSEPPEAFAVTLCTTSRVGRRAPSCGPIRISFSFNNTSLSPTGQPADETARLGAWTLPRDGLRCPVALSRAAREARLLEFVHDHQVLAHRVQFRLPSAHVNVPRKTPARGCRPAGRFLVEVILVVSADIEAAFKSARTLLPYCVNCASNPRYRAGSERHEGSKFGATRETNRGG